MRPPHPAGPRGGVLGCSRTAGKDSCSQEVPRELPGATGFQASWGRASTHWGPLYFRVLPYDSPPHWLQKEVSLVEWRAGRGKKEDPVFEGRKAVASDSLLSWRVP